MIPLLDFCRYSIRLNASRGMAYRTWQRYQHANGNEPDFETFCSHWKVARRLERQHAEKTA